MFRLSLPVTEKILRSLIVYSFLIGKYLGDLRKLNHVIVLKAGFEPQL